MAQLVKNPPAMQETWVRNLGQEDPLEKGKATQLQFSGLEHSRLYSPWGRKEMETTERPSLTHSIFKSSHAIHLNDFELASFDAVKAHECCLEELRLARGQGRQPRGATPHQR